MQDTITYIIEFLLHGNNHLISEVGYTHDVSQFHRYRVVIIPSNFFDNDVYGTDQSMPQLPLTQIEQTPLLFGKPLLRKEGNTLLVEADIIASSYFLLSRYEEMLNHKRLRDEHGRFIGIKSLPNKANFIQRPIVDEYGQLLRSWLRQQGCDVNEPKAEYNNIFLTHDVDSFAHFRNLRGTVGGFLRGLLHKGCAIKVVLKSLFSLEKDPAYTFPWLLKQNANVKKSHTIFFVKAEKKGDKLDYPHYKLKGDDAKHFFKMAANGLCEIGLHASYASGKDLERIASEQKRLQKAVGKNIISNRHHYLRSLQAEDMELLIDAGITDDYTLGYADIAGFRLGTCRAVKWINPSTKQVTLLTLHPLTVMDCTLSNTNYMNLDYKSALHYVEQLLMQTKKHGGDVVLLWHNTSIDGNKNYHAALYTEIIKQLAL
jgi:hypothetical protein